MNNAMHSFTRAAAAEAEAWATRLAALPLERLLEQSERLTLEGHGTAVTYARNVFIPLTKLCRDVCHYCTFAETPRETGRAYLSREEVLDIARRGEAAGCTEALFTLGDRPEARYRVAAEALAGLGCARTLDYVRDMAAAVLAETSLLPHLNPGVMDEADCAMLRPVSASMGMMLETISDRLSAPGGPHHGSPDKVPARRLETIAAAGRAGVPFTTGILIGIGETRAERVAALLAIRDLHQAHGHVQEVIVQNFRAKAGTRMAENPDLPLDEHLWTIAAARLILGPEMTIQAPPNLHETGTIEALLRAGVNDWGGVSPVTVDHVNPEAPWPHLQALERLTAAAGRRLVQRLPIGPAHARKAARWCEPAIAREVLRRTDARGLPRTDGWCAGRGDATPVLAPGGSDARVRAAIAEAEAGVRLDEGQIATLFEAEGDDLAALTALADERRCAEAGDAVTFVINRNINYTNMCGYRCGFCAFSKGTAKALRGPAYKLDLDEIGRRAAEAQARGASEVCLQGGIHPDYDGNTYLEILRAVREAAPGIHIHAFSPLEVTHGARSLGLPLADYLARLKAEGLASLPGTAAEILDPAVRAVLCPDKITAEEWLDVMRTAHGLGLRSTATIMFGHVDDHASWARHLAAVRSLQEETGGFTEFVPLPFVHMEAPIWLRGKARSGPTWREALLMQAISRLVLGPVLRNIQVSWVKLGAEGAAVALQAGSNDLGGVLMDESITRAAGGVNGQCFDAADMAALAGSLGRPALRRTTFYQPMNAPAAVPA